MGVYRTRSRTWWRVIIIPRASGGVPFALPVHGTRAGGLRVLPIGVVGKVISSGCAEGWSCKQAIGTTQGFLVEWGE